MPYGDETVEDFLGQEFSLAKITQNQQGKIFREIVVDVGENGRQDLRARATLVDSLPPFEELKEFRTIAQFDAVFPKSERDSNFAFEDGQAVQYWGGFVIEGDNIRVVLATAGVARTDEGDWMLFERDIRESVFIPEW